MRVLPFLSGPLVMAATVFGAGWGLRSAGMLHERLQFEAMGGPAAWVLYGTVVCLGMAHLLFDRVVELARLGARGRRAHRPVVAGPAPVPLPPVPPATTATASAPASPHPPVRVVRAVRRPRVVAPAVTTAVVPLRR